MNRGQQKLKRGHLFSVTGTVNGRRFSSGRRLPWLIFLCIFAWNGSCWAQDAPPARCAGHGDLDSISLTTWESGLGSWSVSTRDVANPETFDSPDWVVSGGLPEGRVGSAAFAENINLGDCGGDNESGVLVLESPVINIPGDLDVLRLSFDHWYDIEADWDGGNVKISVNGGAFQLVPRESIELEPYDDTLIEPLDEYGVILNTNPLAGEWAYTGISGDLAAASWVQTRVNLAGIAQAGDAIRLRFEFGVDCSWGEVGWYVDDVEVYSCAEELPPSPCGNGMLDPGETCDDGNDFNGDGCSNMCQVEDSWQCTAPTAPGDIVDPSFEAGTPNPGWMESSTNFDSIICEWGVCLTGGGSSPPDGTHWAWLGGDDTNAEVASLSQQVVIPSTSSDLTFQLEVPACDSSSDNFQVLIDENPVWRIDGSSPLCWNTGYREQVVDISAYADDSAHTLQFRAETFAANSNVSNFFIDDIRIPGTPSICTIEGQSAQLTLNLTVVNDNGGTAIPQYWTMQAAGPTTLVGDGPSVTSGPAFMPGTYDLSMLLEPAGYVLGDWSCVGGSQVDADTVSLANGEEASCAITANDIAPVLTLKKVVINDNGGTAEASDWTLAAAGPTPLSGPGPEVVSGPLFSAGQYDLSESGGPPGYAANGWVCQGGSQIDMNTVNLSVGQSATCTIQNDDVNPDFAINVGHSGAWFYPETAGQGVLLDVDPASQYIFMAWFTFTAESGEHPFEQRWFTAQGNYAGDKASLVLYESTGGRFNDPQEVSTDPVGDVTLSFSNCNEGLLTYSIDAEQLEGAFPIIRGIPGSDTVCNARAQAATQAVDINVGMDGAWYDLATAGQGFLVDAHPDAENGNFMFVAWFTYGEDTAKGHRWFTAQGGFEGSTAELTLYETTGGSFNDPLKPETLPAGTMNIDFTDCANAVLSFDIPDESLADTVDLIHGLPGNQAVCEEASGTE